MRRLPIVLALASLACSAQMVRPAGESTSKYAPVNERSQPGVVKYLNDGASFVIKRRRESAYKQMFETCHGPYRIVAEGQRVEGGVVMTSTTVSAEGKSTSTERTDGRTTRGTTRTSVEASADGTAISADVHYWYIQYACESAGRDSSMR